MSNRLSPLAADARACALGSAAAASSIARAARRDATHARAAALAVVDVVIAVDDAGRAPLPFGWVHDAVADATRDRHAVDRALTAGLLTVEQHAAKRDAIRVRLRSAVRIESDGDGRAPVVVAFPDVAMHDATLTDAGVAFVRVAHPTADGVCGFVAGPQFRSRLQLDDVAAAVAHAIDPAQVVRLPGERVAPSGSGRVARTVSLSQLRADAAAGRPVSLAEVARSIAAQNVQPTIADV